jgi:DNA repair protein RAD16
MFVLDEEWNPGKRDQAYDRIHRIGQDKPVSIHVIRNEGTVDDWLAEIMENKEALVGGFEEAVMREKLMEWLEKNSEDD